MTTLDVEAVPIGALDPALGATWRELHARSEGRVGPFLHPSFVAAVGRVRPDVEVGVLNDRGRAVGFVPFQRLPFGVGGAAGGRLCDLAGAIVEPGVRCDPEDFTRAVRLRTLRLPRVRADDPLLGSRVTSPAPSLEIDLRNGYDGYREASASGGSRMLRQLGQRSRKLERELGPWAFEWRGDRERRFQVMLEWKAAQRRATGTANVLELPWVRALLDLLRAGQGGGVRPVFSVLTVNGELAAAHLGLRTDRVLHSWVAAYNVDFAQYSPGLILLREVMKAASERGIRRIDLGPGEERYKRRVSTGFSALGTATSCPSSLFRAVVDTMDVVRAWSRKSKTGERLRSTGRALTRAAYSARAAID